MLKRLRINNFQSHKASDIKFHGGVNAIVGPSDCGKSAILRALRWVLFNDQPGDAYRRHGSDKTEASIVIDDMDYTRVRSNKDNKYLVDDEREFDKVKTEVPEELARVFNMDDINVQKQMDAPFLLSENPPEVARVLNRAAGIDDIDACMSRINGMGLENSKELNMRSKDLGDLDEELAKYRRLPDIDARLSTTEKLEKALRKAQTQADDIGSILDGLEAIEGKIRRLEPLSEVSLDGIEALSEHLENTRGRIDDITDNMETLEQLNAKIVDLDTEALEYDIKEALETSAGLANVEKTMDSLEERISDIEEADDSHKDKKKQLAGLEKEFDELMPDTCPLCEQEV